MRMDASLHLLISSLSMEHHFLPEHTECARQNDRNFPVSITTKFYGAVLRRATPLETKHLCTTARKEIADYASRISGVTIAASNPQERLTPSSAERQREATFQGETILPRRCNEAPPQTGVTSGVHVVRRHPGGALFARNTNYCWSTLCTS